MRPSSGRMYFYGENKIFLLYFSGQLGSGLVCYNPASLPGLLAISAGDFNQDFLLGLGLVMGAPLVDRTGTLSVAAHRVTHLADGSKAEAALVQEQLRITNLYPVPPRDATHFRGQEKTHAAACSALADLLEERAKIILEMAKNEKKELKVLWLGGIDTSAMVAAFDNLVTADPSSRSMIKICYCESSRAEYGGFFRQIVSKFRSQQIPRHVRDILTEAGEVEVSAKYFRIFVEGH